MKEVLIFSETSVLTRATWHNIPEDAILHSHRRENLKSYRIAYDRWMSYHFSEEGILRDVHSKSLSQNG
jgi:hypothetical protein